MSYFTKCSICGANLDPNETCECESMTKRNKRKFEQLTNVDSDGQIELREKLNKLLEDIEYAKKIRS